MMFGRAFHGRRELFLLACFLLLAAALLPRFSFAVAPILFEITDATASTNWGFHTDTHFEMIAQSYAPPTDQVVCTVSHQLSSIGSNPGSADLTVFRGGATPEAGIVIATSSVPANALAIPYETQYTRFPLSSCVTLAEGETYWFRFTNSGPQFTGFLSRYRPSSEYPYSSSWRFHPFTIQPFGWNDFGGEFSFKLEGPDDPNPTLQNLAQFDHGGGVLPEGATSTQGTVTFQAALQSPTGNSVRLEQDLRTGKNP